MADRDDKLEHHLADRLGEQQDFFQRAERTVSNEVTIEGASHLDGRKVQDTFTRGGRAPVVRPQPEKKKANKLEHHLASRLKEVNDAFGAGAGGEAVEAAMREHQRRMRGGQG